MNKKDLILVISKWLLETKKISNIRELGYKFHSEQNFINLFDFIIAVLNKVGLRYLIVDLQQVTKENIDHLPLPFLSVSYVESNGAKIILNAEIARDTHFLETDRNYYAILLGDEDGTKVSLKNRILGGLERMGTMVQKIILLALFTLGFFLDVFGYYEIIIFSICLIGLAISQDLLDEQNDSSNRNSLVKKICSGGSSSSMTTDCKKLADKSPKLFNYIEWSGLGVMIFSFLIGIVFLMGLTSNEDLLQFTMTIAGSIAIILSFFSFYEQYRQRIFCRSCTLVMLVFYALFFVSVFNCDNCFLIHWNSNTLFLLFVTLIMFIYGVFHMLNDKKMNLLKKNYSYARMRQLSYAAHGSIFNMSFTATMDNEDYSFIEENAFNVNTIDSEAKTLTIFLCAYCSHCLSILEKIVHGEIPVNIQLRLIYLPVAMNYDSEEVAVKTGARIIEVLEKEGIEEFTALFEYCQQVDGDNELINLYIDQNFNTTGYSPSSLKKSDEFGNIAMRNNIDTFPQFMIDNRFASDLYTLEELFFHL
jgi:hypothetical protein